MPSEIVAIIQFITPLILGGASGLLVFWGTLSKYKEKVDSLEKRVESSEERLRTTEQKVTACETRLEEREPIKKYISRKSPLTLTEAGRQLLEESGGKQIIDANQDELLKNIQSREPKSPYDIQESAKQILESLKDDSRLIEVKDFAFKKGLELDVPLSVMAIYLRDIALPKYGWKAEDIDNDKTK